MDDVVNRLARELADAIGFAVTEDSRVEACREKAPSCGLRDAGFAGGRDRLREPERFEGACEDRHVAAAGRAESANRHHGERPTVPPVLAHLRR